MSLISTGGSPDAARVGCVVISFVGLGGVFFCWCGLPGWFVSVVLDILAVLFLFFFELFAKKLTMDSREAIWSLISFVSVSYNFERVLYSCWLEWLMAQEM